MTDQDLRNLVAELAVQLLESRRESDRQIHETSRRLADSLEETNQQLAATGRQLEATDRQLKETDQQLKETDQQLRKTDRQVQETDRQLRDTDRKLAEVGRQLGRLGEKFGSFTEGMALPSMTKILMHRFGMLVVSPRVLVRREGRTMELDVLAYSNSNRNEAYVVEVKSHLREEGLEQLRKTLGEFRAFFPEHAGKKVYGMLAAVDFSRNVAEKTLREGIYLARIHDDEFELQVPEGFQPRAW